MRFSEIDCGMAPRPRGPADAGFRFSHFGISYLYRPGSQEAHVDGLDGDAQLLAERRQPRHLLLAGHQADDSPLAPLARRAAGDVDVRLDARGQAEEDDHVDPLQG